MNVRYGDTVEVTCVDNGQTLVADVLSFDPEKFLSVSLQKSIKLGMKYNSNTKEYFGDLYGKTFTTKGPPITRYTVGRSK